MLSLGFALVLDAHENLLLVESTLRLLSCLLDHLQLPTPGTNLLLQADRIEGILTHFLPHGQLLFLNDNFSQGLEKEFSAAWPSLEWDSLREQGRNTVIEHIARGSLASASCLTCFLL
ncbi:AP-5 complex subunit sigma-1 [Sciurus carolinensis]|uniref:AP-5 complex subunit sigma-1 n=1 Tax=Sciurus carolinensis TaxID=30640 RepID=A0AA41N7H4_SCICA|nr:AP-5 complex subunit sigma-1 [Sciurus carolinensis]